MTPSRRAKANVASWHRWLGLILTFPLLGWIVSAAVMMLVTMNAPNGLAGSYRLNPYNSLDIRLDEARVTPTALLKRLAAEHGIDRVYWLRLQSRGRHLWYVVKPTPFSLALVFDARTGARLDPLPDELLATVANEALAGSQSVRLENAPEYNRYYTADRVPAVRATVAGEQPATLILSRDEGRTLRRLNGDSERFGWWYRTFHVNQFSDHMLLWTTLLYACGVGVVVLTVLGYQLFWWRRRPIVLPSPQKPAGRTLPARRLSARNLHRKLGLAVGGVLSVELVVGMYLWLSLGPLEDPFRGKASFSTNWRGGFPTDQVIAEPSTVLGRIPQSLHGDGRPIQAIEWRRLGDRDAWLVTPRLDREPHVFDGATGAPIEALSPAIAGAIAQHEVIGNPSYFYVGPGEQLWMDLNRPLAVYRFRFDDPGSTDVYVSQNTGQIIQRRPYFWRLFGPFLAVHMFSFTGKPVIDMTVLALFQLAVLLLIATGWRMQFPGRGVSGAAPSASAASPDAGPTNSPELAGDVRIP